LARPERRVKSLDHADKKKSAVSSTPFGRNVLGTKSTEVDQEWCGPFSVARQIIAQREEARKRKYEKDEAAVHHPMDALCEQIDLEQKRKLHPSLTWKGDVQASAPSSIYAKRLKRVENRYIQSRVTSLFQLSVNFLVDNWDCVESLGEIDNDCRVAIAKELTKRNQLNAKAFASLVSQNMECLDLIDCAGITQDPMAEVLRGLKGLRYLMLTNAGRCFGPKSINSLIESKASLCCLSISGAYLLQDADAASLIKANSSSLQSVAFDTCPLLGEKFVNAVRDDMKGTLKELSLRNLALSNRCMNGLSGCKEAFRSIKSLTLYSMGINDERLRGILQTIGNSLDMLDISKNYDLTDACLSSIRQFNPGLRSLSLSGVKELSSIGLEAFFTHDLEGLPPPPKLRVLNLSSCDHQAITDQVLSLVTDNASIMRGVGLVRLDIQGSNLVTDSTLEQLAGGGSARTITELNVSYCPLISDKGLGYFVSKVGNQLGKIHIWGCAQLTDGTSLFIFDSVVFTVCSLILFSHT
jgi:hypothetical protein